MDEDRRVAITKAFYTGAGLFLATLGGFVTSIIERGGNLDELTSVAVVYSSIIGVASFVNHRKATLDGVK